VIRAGIEKANFFPGSASLNAKTLAEKRNLDMQRFDNLLMQEKTVILPYEDTISLGVNAAMPIIRSLSQAERDRIEMVVSCTESAVDFGKSISTYFQDLLGLSRNCRLFEIKNACNSGAVGFQVALNYILSQVSPGAKVLVIASDISRFLITGGNKDIEKEWSLTEPSGGSGAAAVLFSDQPDIFELDPGANGFYGYEVMDTCRPSADIEAGDADLSLLSYLDCCENTFRAYQQRVEGADYGESFDYLAFHTPFGGMVKGAHRSMMRKFTKLRGAAIQDDFDRRVIPGLTYCRRVGNVMGATMALSLMSSICNGEFEQEKRIGCFSYGSGCASEFFSGVVGVNAQAIMRDVNIEGQLNQRYALSMDEYEQILHGSADGKFGTRYGVPNTSVVPEARRPGLLYLKEINDFHREYEWQ